MNKLLTGLCKNSLSLRQVSFLHPYYTMFTIIGIMFTGIAVGFIFRKRRIFYISHLITGLIWILLFLLGIEVGGNPQIMNHLYTLGAETLVLTLFCLAGSCVAAWGLWRMLYQPKGGKR